MFRAAGMSVGKRIMAALVAVAAVPAMAEGLSKADWPRDATGHPATGLVLVEARVGLQGQVIRSRVLRESGYVAFDRSALATVSHYHFTPRRVHGAGVIYDMRVPVSFRPQGGPQGTHHVRLMPMDAPRH